MEVWGGNQAIDNGVIMPGLDAWVYARPYQQQDAGGDIHYVSSCATGRIIRLLVADVSGHGKEVAEVAVALRSLMRRYVNYVDQSKLVRGLNEEFTKLSELNRFATAVVATFWSPTDELVISNAGHPRPLLYQSRTGRWQAIENRRVSEGLANIPLGIAEPTKYDELSVRLNSGDLVLVYTDSLVEARGADGKDLGEAGLMELLLGLDVKRPEMLIASLLEAIKARTGSEFADDVTALLVRPNALKPRSGMKLSLTAAWRIMKAAVRSMIDRGRPEGLPQLSVRSIGGAMIGKLNGRD
jgi:serine phosphatase RsbU (regulator of sigma subunit)